MRGRRAAILGSRAFCGPVLNLLKAAGENCERLLERRIRNVPVDDVQLDEIWTYCKKKERRKTAEEKGRTDIGDQFVFIAIERNTKLVITWHLGRRDGVNTQDFITKLRDATAAQRFQLSSDAFKAYPTAIEWGLHDRADYAQIIKLYGKLPTGRESYRPPKIKGRSRPTYRATRTRSGSAPATLSARMARSVSGASDSRG